MAEPATRIVYEFNQFRLDLQQRLLLSGADGSPIPLPPKVFDTLLYFVERRGELLDKSTLLKAIWPNVVVEENSLNQNISALRRALGESPGEHRFIITEPGRGYRFVANVRTAAIPSSPQAARDTNAATSVRPDVAPSAASGSRSSIAVLPFANLTGDPGKEYFSDGMAEELIHTLARIPGLRVPARTSSFAYKGRNVDVRQIARDLEVGAVLEGSVRSAGERIRVTAQLVDGQTGYHIWSQNYDRQFEDLFKLQDELASAIVQTLRVRLDGHTPGGGPYRPPTQDLEAYQLYLQALAMQVSAGEQNLRPAFDMLERAIARDPGFARAYNALAATRAVAIVMDVQLPGTVAKAEAEVLRALALDPNLGATHAALGIMNAAQGKWVSAEEKFQEAFARDDTDPSTQQSYGLHVAGSAGYLRRYLEVTLKTHQLAPAWIANLMNVAVAYLFVADTDSARRYIDLAITLGLPKTVGPIPDLISTLAARAGRLDEAMVANVEALTPSLKAAGGVEAVKLVFAALGNSSERRAAIDALDRLRSAVGAGALTQMINRRHMAWYTLLGALDPAYEIANASLDHFARSGTIGTAWAFLWMQEMLAFRQDPRFQAFCARMHLFDYWNRYGPPDNCELRDGKLICG